MKTLLTIIFCLAMAGSLWAATATPTLTITFDYPADQNYRAEGFTLFMDDIEVCSTDDPAIREFSCAVLMEDSEHSFTLMGRSNVDPQYNSVYSEPALYTPPDEWFGEIPTPTNLNVTGVMVQILNVIINN